MPTDFVHREMTRKVKKKIPLGIRFFHWISRDRDKLYRGMILLLTFLAYMSYHLSRKPISIVKGTLYSNCSTANIQDVTPSPINWNNSKTLTTGCPSWAPFDQDNAEDLLGALDLAYLFSYAIGIYFSGFLAEHLDLRHFLTVGMICSGLFTCLFGMGYFWNIHSLAFFLTVQIITGFFQSTGWPSVVACVGNWFGKGKRGLIMGIWNSHTSFGNIAGSAIAGIWSGGQWGYSFVVPGLIIIFVGVLIQMFLVVDPSHVGCSPPLHHENPVQNTITVSVDDDDDDGDGYNDTVLTTTQEEVSRLLPSEDKDHPHRRVLKQGAHGADAKAISFFGAFLIPGVIEFSFCLFFAKLVSYTFLYWLPFYISNTKIDGVLYSSQTSADLSTFFDFGGILGGVTAGVISDYTNCYAITTLTFLIFAGPMLFLYRFFANATLTTNIALMFIAGVFVNGPYALITTAVSANLGTHESLRGDTKAMATVTAIIDGTGSIGAALGPLLTGLISSGKEGWNDVFYMLITADILAALLMLRLVYFEVVKYILKRRPYRHVDSFNRTVSVANSILESQQGKDSYDVIP